jgi:hypothetical protein
MNVFPILTREWRCLDWQRVFYRQRLGVGATAAAGLVALAVADRFGGGVNVSRMVTFAPLTGIAPFMLFILGLNGASALLATERREGTLGLLLITRLSGWDIVFGKLLQAVVTQGVIFFAAIPALVLPLLAMGSSWRACFLLGLAYGNLLFFSLALGLLGAVLTEGRSAASWCLLWFSPVLLYSTPFILFIPSGRSMEWLSALQWFNPCAAVAHASSAAAGFQPERFWGYLGATHGVGWLFAGVAGLLLPSANRRQAGRTPSKGWSWFSRSKSTSFKSRERLLERNPFLWLNSRDRWASTMVWLWVLLPAAGWSWFIWLTWVLRGLNVTFVFVIAIGLSWAMTLACMVPAHAARQMVEDRLSGVLEVILCAPITPRLIAQGTWMALRRYFLLPVSVIMGVGLILMIGGYATFGFGGMFDTEDRTHWLWAWLTGIIFVPPTLWALSWVSLRRALFARNLGEASAIGFVQVLFTVFFVLWLISTVSGYSSSPLLKVVLAFVAALLLLTFGVIARRNFLKNLRSA